MTIVGLRPWYERRPNLTRPDQSTLHRTAWIGCRACQTCRHESSEREGHAAIRSALDELRAYKPNLAVPDDLDAFWDRTLAEARSTELVATATPVESGLTRHRDARRRIQRVRRARRSRAGCTCPPGATGPLPAVVEFVGYGGGRGLPHERVLWATRRLRPLRDGHARPGFQPGSSARPPIRTRSVRRSTPGFMTRGILDPDDYYYRRVFVDGVRAVEAVRATTRPSTASESPSPAEARAAASASRSPRSSRTSRPSWPTCRS